MKNIARFGYRQAVKAVRLIKGYPLTTPPLGSATIDRDDVEIARYLLRHRDIWHEQQIVRDYQDAFSAWNGSRYAFAFMGGRVALSVAISALGLKPGDRVIIPGYTCIVVPNAFRFGGINIDYSDIELDTYGLDASKLEEKITPATKAILLHHLYGLVCRDYEAIIEIARKHGLYVIEDCAQSTGAVYKGKKVGYLGDVAFYSSEQSKIFTTVQGGMLCTNNDDIAEKIVDIVGVTSIPSVERTEKLLWNIIINYYSFKEPGRWWKGDIVKLALGSKILISTTDEEIRGEKPKDYACKMPPAIAAIGLNQLKKIDNYNERRRSKAKEWDVWCDENGYRKPFVTPCSTPVYLRYPVLVEPERKADTSWALKGLKIELGKWFLGNLHPIKAQIPNCPNADKAVLCCVNFPTTG